MTTGALVLVRHGETTLNVGLAAPSFAAAPLTVRGEAQARALGDRLRPADIVLCSPFASTRATAALVLGRSVPAALIDARVGELCYLSPEATDGTTQAERRGRRAAYWERCSATFCDGPGAETFAGFVARIRSVLAGLPVGRATPIAVITHGLVIECVRMLVQHPGATDDVLMRELRDRVFRAGVLGNCDHLTLGRDSIGSLLGPEAVR